MLQKVLEKYRAGTSGIIPPAAISLFLSGIAVHHVRINRKEYDRTEQECNYANKNEYNRNTLIFFKNHNDVINKSTRYLSEYAEARLSLFPAGLGASLTIEAAIVLPLFIFMMFILIFPLRVMEEERRLQNAAEAVGKQLATAEYVQSVGTELLKKDDESNEALEGVINGAEEGVALGIILAKALGLKSVGIPYFGDNTSVFSGDDDDMFKVELVYDIKFPFQTYFIPAPTASVVVNRRAWTGSAGGRGRSKYSLEGEGEEDETDRTVYLGKTSTVYHDDPACHYLSNVMKTADASDMDSLRNESGGKYHACPSCKPVKSGTVYYFESGTAYHSSEHCKAVTAYSKAVKLSEVGDMRACSYCGKSHKAEE